MEINFSDTIEKLQIQHEMLLSAENVPLDAPRSIATRYKNPVVTASHVPLVWRYDLNPETNPYFMERLGINAVFNAGAIELDGKICLVARVEGSDRKSFFAVAESTTGVDQFVFREKPVQLPDCDPNETNVYDMRLTKHEDGWIYGVFCSESSANDPKDLSAAVAQAGIVRTKDLNTWERLPNLITKQSPQQRNVCLLPKFVDGKYAFYTRPMDGFIDTGSGGGIGYGLVDDILHPVIETEKMTSMRKYHTITEAKNGSGATPIATEKGWLHIAHGVRNTAAGLRYVIYVFVTDLEAPSRVIAEPSGYLMHRSEQNGSVMFPTWSSRMGQWYGKTARFIFTMRLRIHGCTLPLLRLTSCSIMHSILRPIRFAVSIVSSSGAN